MSLKGLAKRFHRSRSSKDDASSGDQHNDSPTASSRSTSTPSRTGTPGPAVSEASSVQMPAPEPAESVSMPVPEPAPAPSPEPEMLPNSMDGALAELTPIQARLDAGPAVKKVDKALDTLGDRVTSLTTQTNKAMTIANNISTIVSAAASNSGEIAQKIERGIQRFADDLPWLMKALDEVARIHPVVTVAVLAFKAVYALESTRQENDRRVMTLYVEMKDMMMVMVQLKGVENRTHVGLDGRPLKDRLEELAEKTAKDIKDCANLCDTFVKKKLLVKVFKGPVWAERLAGFVKVFEDRKADFEFALTMHTANSVSDVKRQNVEIQAKLDAVLGLFNKFVSADERRIAVEIDAKGGYTKVRQDDEALKALIVLDNAARAQNAAEDAAPRDVLREKTARNKLSLAVDELKVELREDVADALEKNLDAFTGKFELQVDLLQVALEKYIRAENDRVIGAVTDAIKQGPHMKIKDLELRKIWQDMGWRGNVKARLFVLTLQDHYRDLFDNATNAERPDAIANDEWALEYLGLNWLRPLMEAFDDDASGYVTITEVNKLMDMRPSSLTWSIPHWLAYWAVGWRVASTSYITRIKTAIGRMREALPGILARNRVDLDWYFLHHWHEAFAATAGFQTWEDETLEGRFQDYVKYEEDRIRGNLEKIKYNIDTPETVSLVVGSGRLEKCFLILLCLVLEHDLRLVRAATRIVVLRQELTNAQTTIWHVFRAFDRRFVELNDLFTEQKVDRNERFKEFAFGLFLQVSPASDIWSTGKLSDGTLAIYIADEEGPITLDGIEEETKPSAISTVMFEDVDAETEDDRAAPDPMKSIVGEWNGFAYVDAIYPRRPMLSLRFQYSKKDGEDFCGSGVEFDEDTYTLSGTCLPSEDGGPMQLKWDITYPDGVAVHYNGTLVDGFTITGTRVYGEETESDYLFILKKIPAPYMTLRPRPSLLAASKYRYLWHYAIAATLQDVRRRLWSWSYFAARRDVRRKYLEENFRRKRYISEPPEEEYNAGLNEARRACTAVETRLYESTCEYMYLTFPYHWSALCEGPPGSQDVGMHYIEGARCICLTCVPDKDDFSRHVSFCDDPECLGADHPDGFWATSFYSTATVHRTTHDILKVRTVIHHLLWPSLSGQAAVALELVRTPGVLPDPPVEGVPTVPTVEDKDESEKPSEAVELSKPEAANEPSETHVEGGEAHEESPKILSIAEAEPAPVCCVCREAVYMGRYICDACDKQMLIACWSCQKPFPQPEWYYGFKPTDFTCPTCCGRGVKRPDPDDPDHGGIRRHVYTHPLVRCKPLILDTQPAPETEEKTTDSRLAKLEERIEQLQDQLVKLESKQEAMQTLLLSRFTEALTRMPSVVDSVNGQAA
ncbi:hypothetical protein V8D89_004150 [Ganoderma adspersum]